MLALITGGTGYVAGHLARRLLADGITVRLTRRPSARPMEPAVDKVEWIDVADIGPDTDWRAAIDGVDLVFHLAGVAHRLSASQAALVDEYERVNARGTEQLARSLVARGGHARLVLLSSIGAVCTTSATVIGPTTVPNPDSAYGRSKLRAEQLLAQVCAGSNLQWCALRAPLVYGPDAPGNMRRLLKFARLRVLPLGRARARRSFVFVGNLVDALAICGSSPAVAGRVLMVADRETTSVAELLRLAADIRGESLMLLPVPLALMNGAARLADGLRPGATDRSDSLSKSLQLLFGALQLDASEFMTLTQWQPPFSQREGMAATLRGRAA
jgi:nucleoside-diphosphate-sugar epimerase